MNTFKKLTPKACRKWLEKVPTSSGVNYIKEVENLLDCGECEMFEMLKEDGTRLGKMVASIKGLKFFIFAFQSEKLDDYKETFDAICNLAESYECETVEFLTLRPYLANVAMDNGFKVREITLEKTLNGKR